MPQSERSLVIDANLLILFIVGTVNPGLISSHRRLTAYTLIDYQSLLYWLDRYGFSLVLLPHALAEASNLATYVREPAKTRIRFALKTLIETYPEVQISSRASVSRPEFLYLGLTDAALLELCGPAMSEPRPTLLTTDYDLATAAARAGYGVEWFVRDKQ